MSNYDQLVGDYTNPILQPWAAEIVKKHGELSLAGVTYPNPANQCWPEPVPFIFKNFGMQMLQQPDKITMLYDQDHEVRHVRMNEPHPAQVTPSWYGDSVGHYEGDTLVIDTVGIKTDRPFAMIDLFGTPYTKALHVVERYRLLDYEAAKDGIGTRRKGEFAQSAASVDRNYRGKFLQLHFTVEDEGVFTTPWTATMTYGRDGSDEWPETVCAENMHEYYYNKDSGPDGGQAGFLKHDLRFRERAPEALMRRSGSPPDPSVSHGVTASALCRPYPPSWRRACRAAFRRPPWCRARSGARFRNSIPLRTGRRSPTSTSTSWFRSPPRASRR